jgi:hypothetical protein
VVGARIVGLVGLGLSWSGCSFDDGGDELDCGELAIRTTSGDADPCDVDACQSCVDTCGGDCMVLESFPPQYSCGDEGSWSVYDECPDWTLPTATGPHAEDVTDLGCGSDPGESLVAAADGPGRIAVTHTDAALGCCPASIEVDVVAQPDATLSVSYTLVDDPCECACGIDVSYDIVEVSPGQWTVVAVESGASAPVTVP